jgi:hypothetical protein
LWKGTNSNGKTGVFPRVFVELVDGEELKLAKTTHDSPPELGDEASEVSTNSSPLATPFLLHNAAPEAAALS